MALKIVSGFSTGGSYLAYHNNFEEKMNGRRVTIYQRRNTGLWWIEDMVSVPCTSAIGPFDTPELAWSTLQLLKD